MRSIAPPEPLFGTITLTPRGVPRVPFRLFLDDTDGIDRDAATRTGKKREKT